MQQEHIKLLTTLKISEQYIIHTFGIKTLQRAIDYYHQGRVKLTRVIPFDNTGGILVFITPGLPIKTTFDTIVRNNFIVNNNTPNFGIPGSTVAGIPAGTGILNMAGDQTTIEGNIITGNKVIGILITDHMNAPNVTLDPGADPNSDEIAILDNMMWNNGYDTIPEIAALKTLELVEGEVQILNVGTSTGSCILDPDKNKLISDAIEQGAIHYGMQTFDQSLMFLLQNGYITYEEALAQSSNPDDFALRVSGIASSVNNSAWGDFESAGGGSSDAGGDDDDFNLDEFEIERF